MKRIVLVLTSVVVLTGMAFWWSGRGGNPSAAPAFSAEELDEATRAPLRDPAQAGFSVAARIPPAANDVLLFDPVLVSPCVVGPCQEQDVASPVDGILEDVLVELGQSVEPGQLLGRLEAGQVKAQVELLAIRAASESAERIAKAQFDEADSRVKYAEKANGSEIHSVPELEHKTYLFQRERFAHEVRRAREEREAAGKELEKARHLLLQHEQRSRLHGTVTKVYKRRGEAVKQAEPLFRVADHRRLHVEGLCKVQQGDLLKVGMPALVEPELRGEQLTELAGHTGAVNAVAASGDGALLASASDDRTVILWDWTRGRRVAALPHPGEVYAAQFLPSASADSDRLLTGCADGKVRLWSLGTGTAGNVIVLPIEHAGAVRALAVSADGTRCVSGGDDRKIALWDLTANGALGYLGGEDVATAHQGAVTALNFTPDGRIISAGRDNVVRVWGADGRLLATQAGRTGDVAQLGVHPAGHAVLFDHAEELRLLDPATWSGLGSLRNRRQGRFQGVAAFSPRGKLILTGSTNGRLQLWDLPAAPEEAIRIRSSHARGAAGEAASLWDLGGREIRQYAPPTTGVNCAAFAPDERAFFTGGADKVVRVWSVPAPSQCRRRIEARVTYVGSLIERGTDTIRVRAELENPATAPLRPGVNVSLKLFPETAGAASRD